MINTDTKYSIPSYIFQEASASDRRNRWQVCFLEQVEVRRQELSKHFSYHRHPVWVGYILQHTSTILVARTFCGIGWGLIFGFEGRGGFSTPVQGQHSNVLAL